MKVNLSITIQCEKTFCSVYGDLCRRFFINETTRGYYCSLFHVELIPDLKTGIILRCPDCRKAEQSIKTKGKKCKIKNGLQ